MAKQLPKTDAELVRLVVRQQRAIAMGKRGYKLSDQLTDELTKHMREGRAVPLALGCVARLKDKFAETNRVGYGGAVRRFEIEVSQAEDVTGKV
jgi:hypothetical protein